MRTFNLVYRPVGVQSHDQAIPLRAGLGQVTDMAGMEQFETTVGKHDFLFLGFQGFNQGGDFGTGDNF
jgi:hypothetical protein